MFSPQELAELQAQAESLMQDRFAAFSPGAVAVDANGMKQPGWNPEGETLGKTQGSIARDAVTRTVTIGGSDYDVVDAGLHLPVGAFITPTGLAVRIGWEFQCVAIGAATDPGQLGRRWHVVSVPSKSWMTARRLDVAEVPALDLTA